MLKIVLTMTANTRTPKAAVAVVALAIGALTACTRNTGRSDIGPGTDDGGITGFVCRAAGDQTCEGNVHKRCILDGEFVSLMQTDCAQQRSPSGDQLICVPDGINNSESWCFVCVPGTRRCQGGRGRVVEICNATGTAWEAVENCDLAAGLNCLQGRCVNLCQSAEEDRSYAGCEFYAADLDNASIGRTSDASGQQYAIVVSNPTTVEATVWIEIDNTAFGAASAPERIAEATVLPGDLEVFRLPRREVDGASSMEPCTGETVCQNGEQCFCADGNGPATGSTGCFCRNRAGTAGLNDGTHSALTSRAYHVRSDKPVIAYQFNPLDNVGVFSNDASMLVPVPALGRRYTVIGWPQTIANATRPEEDFDPNRTDEDLRAFVSIIGSAENTTVNITLGSQVRRVVSVGGFDNLGPGSQLNFTLGAFDIINLETQGFNADFTGSVVESSAPVAVFSGSEASDAPRFDDLANRQCCGDHVEEQLVPDFALGQRFFIGRTPTRTRALNRAYLSSSIGEVDEPESVRILAISPGETTVRTSMPEPNDLIRLQQGEDILFVTTQDLTIEADQRVSVLQAISSQFAVGIPSGNPGGDPSIMVVPPVEQYRREYVFLTPQYYAFDFFTVVAPRTARVFLDEEPLDPSRCSVAPADGRLRTDQDAPPEYLVYRCQISFPDVETEPRTRVLEGEQNDGYHTLRATAPVSLMITGFDNFVSYGYVGGLDVRPLVR